MYITPLERPRLSAILENVRIDKTGRIYVHSPGGQVASPARVKNLYRALTYLQKHHRHYQTQEVRKSIARLQQKMQLQWCQTKRKRIRRARQSRNSGNKGHTSSARVEETHVVSDTESEAAHQPKRSKRSTDPKKNDTANGEVEIEYTFPQAPTGATPTKEDLDRHRFMANLSADADVKIFPHLFPTGEHGYNPRMKFSSYARQRLLNEDPRFEQSADYTYFLLEMWLKKRISANTNVRIAQQAIGNDKTSQDALRRQIYTTLRDIPGTQPYFYAKKGLALSMYEQLGIPQWFMTLTCHAKQPEILTACIYARLLRNAARSRNAKDRDAIRAQATGIYYKYQNDPEYKWNPNIENTEPTSPTPPAKGSTNANPAKAGLTANELCSSMPAIVSRQFFHQVKKFMRWLAPNVDERHRIQTSQMQHYADEEHHADSEIHAPDLDAEAAEPHDDDTTTVPIQDAPRENCDAPPFIVIDYIVRVEWQKRGYPHVHMLLWTTARVNPQAPEYQLTDEEATILTDEDVAAKIQPRTVEELADKFICTTSSERWLHVHINRKPENANYRAMPTLAQLQKHNCNQYCRRHSGAQTYCRFGYPQHVQPRAKRRTAKEQWSQRVKSSIAVRRHPGLKNKPDPINGQGQIMGQYNPAILRQWQGSMDIQPICELTMASRYILGYTFKSEEDLSAARRVEELLDRHRETTQPFNQTTYRIAHAATQARTTSTFEACHLLQGFPVIFFSRDNVWVQVGRPQTWTLWVPTRDESKAINNPDKYADTHCNQLPAAQARYARIQESFAQQQTAVPVQHGAEATTLRYWKDITFFDYCAGFQQTKIEREPPTPRHMPAIVGHRNFSPDTEPEDFYFSKLLLHHVWQSPGDWLREEDQGSHAKAFNRIAADTQTYPSFLTSTCYPALETTVIAAKEIQKVQAAMYIKANIRSNLKGWTLSRYEQDKYKDSLQIMQTLKQRHGADIDFDTPETVPSGLASDVFAPVQCGEDCNVHHASSPHPTRAHTRTQHTHADKKKVPQATNRRRPQTHRNVSKCSKWKTPTSTHYANAQSWTT